MKALTRSTGQKDCESVVHKRSSSEYAWHPSGLLPGRREHYHGKRLSRPKCFHAEGGEFRLAEVYVQEGETLESALRRFKRKVQQEDIIKEIKRHSFYLKPGEKRRTKEALARKRNRKKRSKDIE